MAIFAIIDDIVQALQDLPEDKLQQARKFVLALKTPSNPKVNGPDLSVLKHLDYMRRTSFKPPPGCPSVVDMVREDRDR